MGWGWADMHSPQGHLGLSRCGQRTRVCAVARVSVGMFIKRELLLLLQALT